MAESLLIDTDARGVRTLTLNRPERRNALDEALLAALHAALEAAARDGAVRVVVLTGAGSAFSGGMDLGWMREAMSDEAGARGAARQLAVLLATLDALPKPTVARVNGAALGGAMGIVACCDVAIAAASAEFALPEVRLGLAPAVVAPHVVAAVGERQARWLFVSGERLAADEALRAGLVHRVVAPDALDAAVAETVECLLKGAPPAQAEAKRLARHARLATAEEGAALFARLRTAPEADEGLRAFFAKRKPGWDKSP
jgi:methylglutaconyl-CoA hydratase